MWSAHLAIGCWCDGFSARHPRTEQVHPTDHLPAGWYAGAHAGVAGARRRPVKRLRHTPRVLIAVSDQRGWVKPGVQDVEGTAEMITDVPELDRLVVLLKNKYGFMYTLSGWVNRLRGHPPTDGVEIRISVPD
jgi:hypothetical protein